MSQEFSHEEEILGKVYDHRLFARVLRYVRPYWQYVALGLALSVLVSILSVAPPLLMREIIDGPIASGDAAGINSYSLVYLLLLVLGFAAMYANMYLLQKLGQLVMRDLRNQLFKHLQRQRLGFFDRMPVGRLMTRMTSDVQALNEMVSTCLVTIFQDVFMLLAMTGVLFWINWQLALKVFLVLPLMVIAVFYFSLMMRFAYREMRLALSRMNSFTQESVTGMRVIQAFRGEKRGIEEFTNLAGRLRDTHLRTIFWFAFLFPVVDILAAVAAGIAVWHAGGADPADAVTVGTLVAFLLLIERFFAPLRDLAEKYNIMQAAMASSERIFKLLDTRERIDDPSRGDANDTDPTTGRVWEKGAVETPKPSFNHSIRFENVWFAYIGEEWVLRDITFEVKRGEHLALVGATGSGKTTITSLLLRFYEIQKGRILLDGKDIRDFALADLRALFAIVLQDVTLFTGDIRDNIRLGLDLDDDRLWEICKRVNADKFIGQYEDRLDHEVRERGATFSAGERQLVAFARALAFNPQVLVLDEATSNIDTETEKLIQEALERLMENRTAVVIAHRLSTIQHADNILVLHHGRLIEQGKHQELLAHGGLYKKLYELQAGRATEVDHGDEPDFSAAAPAPA
jgi:ATP-binding cassette subfamily B multidrug efflux pump